MLICRYNQLKIIFMTLRLEFLKITGCHSSKIIDLRSHLRVPNRMEKGMPGLIRLMDVWS